MEYLFLLTSETALPYTINFLMDKYDNLLTMSTFERTIIPMFVMICLLYLINMITHIVYSIKNCRKSWGNKSGSHKRLLRVTPSMSIVFI